MLVEHWSGLRGRRRADHLACAKRRGDYGRLSNSGIEAGAPAPARRSPRSRSAGSAIARLAAAPPACQGPEYGPAQAGTDGSTQSRRRRSYRGIAGFREKIGWILDVGFWMLVRTKNAGAQRLLQPTSNI